MALVNSGRNVFAAAIIGDSYTAFNNSNARLGVGDSTTVFSAAHTDLQAATNKFRKAMNATYPQRSTNVLTFQATFVEADANFAWQEWGVFDAASSGNMLNRKVESLGTKPNTEQWRLTATLTVTAP